jgi:hypothetical protein
MKLEHIMDNSVNKSLSQLLNLAVLSVALPAVLVPLVVIGTSSVGNAEELKTRQLIAQSCGRNIDVRSNGQNRIVRKGRSAYICGYTFSFQDDGNLVLYRGNQVFWATGTGGRGDAFVIQSDGNMVLYGRDRRPLWATNTYGNPGAFFSIQSDGNLVVYRSDGRQALWASGTAGGQVRSNYVAREWSGGGQTTPSQPSQRESQRKVTTFVNFANGQRGITRYDRHELTFNSDGQCVTLIARYLQDHYAAPRSNLSLDHGRGTAASVGRQFSNLFLPLSDPSDPIPGSIISFPHIGEGYGHVALVVSSQRSGSNLNIQILDSNGDGAGSNSVTRLQNITVDTRSLTAQGYGGNIQWVNPRD